MKKTTTEQPGLAVALLYEGDGAPRVTAKGAGVVAERIIELAREHDVPLYEDRNLVKLAASVELGEEIPRTLYLAVAEVLAFAYHVTGRIPGDGRREHDNP